LIDLAHRAVDVLADGLRRAGDRGGSSLEALGKGTGRQHHVLLGAAAVGRGAPRRYVAKKGIQGGRNPGAPGYRYGILDGGQGAALGAGIALRAGLLPYVALRQQVAAVDQRPEGNTAGKTLGRVERFGLERRGLFGVSRSGSVVDVVLCGAQSVLERLQGAGGSE